MAFAGGTDLIDPQAMGKLFAMRIFRAQPATTWVTLVAYLIVGPVLPIGQVFCEGLDGHRAIEFAYITCPANQGEAEGDAPDEGLASIGNRSCTDVPITSCNVQECRRRDTAELNNIISLPFAGLLPPPSSADEPMVVHLQLRALPPGHGCSLDSLRTVVLLI